MTLLKPVIRQSLVNFICFSGPGIGLAVIKESGLAVIGIVAVGEFPWSEQSSAGSFLPGHPDTIVFLPTLSAEHERQKGSRSIIRDVFLTMNRDEAVFLVLQGSINGIPTADELVKSKGENRKP